MLKQSKNRQIKRGHIVPVWEESSKSFKMFYKTKKGSQYVTNPNLFMTIQDEEKQKHLDIWNKYLITGKNPVVNKGLKSDLQQLFSSKDEVKNSFVVKKLSVWKQFKVWLKSYLSFN